MGDLHLDVNDGTWNNDVMAVLSGQQEQTSETAAFSFREVDLSAYTGDIGFRFRYDGVTSYAGDVCLDDIEITGELKNAAPNTPTLSKLFDNERTADNTPAFQFKATDPDSDDLEYQIEIDDDYNFGSINITANSETPDPGFVNTENGGDTHPFTHDQVIQYTVQGGSELSNGTYWWRVKAWDPSDSDSSYSSKRSFTINTAMDPSYSEWFQTTDEQFATNALNSTETTGEDSVKLGGW